MARVVLQADGTPEWREEETVLLTLPGTRLFREADDGVGRLFVTSQRLVWVSDVNVEAGLGWHFRDIALHAIARTTEVFSRPSLYCQLAVAPEREDDEDIRPEELRLVPSDDLSLSRLFDAMSEAAAMNPDPMSEGDEEMPDFDIDMHDCQGANFDDAE